MGNARARRATQVLPHHRRRAGRARTPDARVDDVRKGHGEASPTRQGGEMTREEQYINRVLDMMPLATPTRSQIAMELRGHITERIAHGGSVDDVLRQLGDPVRLAESYLAAVPLVSASFGQRAAAKIIDVSTVLLVMVLIAWLLARLVPLDLFPMLIWVAVFGGSIVFGLYLVFAEAWLGQTLGKRLLGIGVVRESGARIGI